jgi:hypothetical protein
MPTHETTCILVYPDGYEESTIGDKWRWLLYVERMLQEDGTYLWRVSGSHGQRGMVLTRKGKWIYDTALQKRWTRHSYEDALALAYKYVNTAGGGPYNWTMQQFEDHFKKKEKTEA